MGKKLLYAGGGWFILLITPPLNPLIGYWLCSACWLVRIRCEWSIRQFIIGFDWQLGWRSLVDAAWSAAGLVWSVCPSSQPPVRHNVAATQTSHWLASTTCQTHNQPISFAHRRHRGRRRMVQLWLSRDLCSVYSKHLWGISEKNLRSPQTAAKFCALNHFFSGRKMNYK